MAESEIVPDAAHQPRTFEFPKREFGKTSVTYRAFQAKWFDRWSWLHYDEAKDVVFCFTCLHVHANGKLVWSANADGAFIDRGFCNWKDATCKFDVHQHSKCHKEAVLKVVTLPGTTADVGESLSAQHRSEKLENRRSFLKILSSIRFLARQGLPLHGANDGSNSNITQLLVLCASDDERLAKWLMKKTDTYTSGDIQNEILSVMANDILRSVAEEVKSAKFCTVMADETTDVSNKEQVVMCLRWIDSTLTAHEDFIGLYEVDSTQVAVLFKVIEDVLLRLGISINSVRGQCYDGASAMSGLRGGVATMLQKKEPRAIYTHCYGHSLNLACMDAIKKCSALRNSPDIVQEITN